MKQPAREYVQTELKELKELASTINLSEFKEGLWFSKLLRHALNNYSNKVDAAYFVAKYPNLPRDGIVDRRVALAKNYAAIAGGLNAGAYSTAISATIGSVGGASPLAIPAAAISFVVDLLYTSQLQLKLSYDLSVLYEHPIDIDDPDDLIDLIKVAFGIKAGETLQSAASKLAPEATRIGVKAVASGSRLATLKALPVIGKHLLQRNIIKFAIPVVSIPLSSGINYYSTGTIAKTAKRIYRRRAALREAAETVSLDLLEVPLLALQVVYLVAQADGEVSESEALFINELSSMFLENDEAISAVQEFEKMINTSEPTILQRIATQQSEIKRMLFDVAVVTAASDSTVHKLEKQTLKNLAEVCDCDFRVSDIKRASKQLS